MNTREAIRRLAGIVPEHNLKEVQALPNFNTWGVDSRPGQLPSILYIGEPIHTEARLAGIKLSPYTRKLLRKNPAGTGLVRLNKRLLLDALPEHFRRKRGRGKNMEQKPVTVHLLSSGKWAVLVDVVKPWKLEGKMRSGRQKFERQTQSAANDLCLDINNKLFGKEIARQLTLREVGVPKKLYWELLEPKHPDWLDHPDKIVQHCEKTGFRVELPAAGCLRVSPTEGPSGNRAAHRASAGHTTWHADIPLEPHGLSGSGRILSRNRTGDLAPLESIRPGQSFCHPQGRLSGRAPPGL